MHKSIDDASQRRRMKLVNSCRHVGAAVYAEYNIDRDAMKEGRVILRHTSSHLVEFNVGVDWMEKEEGEWVHTA